MSMSMQAKSSTKVMSADAEDHFEESLEGNATGDVDDWETELGLKILKIESKISAAGSTNRPVTNMLNRKLATYNAAMELIEENVKVATLIGSEGGLKAIITYITKQAIADAAREETKKYSDKIKPLLPGYRLSKIQAGGLVNASAQE